MPFGADGMQALVLMVDQRGTSLVEALSLQLRIVWLPSQLQTVAVRFESMHGGGVMCPLM